MLKRLLLLFVVILLGLGVYRTVTGQNAEDGGGGLISQLQRFFSGGGEEPEDDGERQVNEDGTISDPENSNGNSEDVRVAPANSGANPDGNDPSDDAMTDDGATDEVITENTEDETVAEENSPDDRGNSRDNDPDMMW